MLWKRYAKDWNKTWSEQTEKFSVSVNNIDASSTSDLFFAYREII